MRENYEVVVFGRDLLQIPFALKTWPLSLFCTSFTFYNDNIFSFIRVAGVAKSNTYGNPVFGSGLVDYKDYLFSIPLTYPVFILRYLFYARLI